jgi:hypothetical protein
MKISTHVFSSLILAGILYPIFQWKAIFVLFGGVLIDSDHYLWFVLKYKKLSIRDAYRHYMKGLEEHDFKDHFGILLIFHCVEFLALIVILSFYSVFVFLFAIGVILHYSLDLIFLFTVPKSFIADYSIIKWLIRTIRGGM